jgi:hypothetical protein
MGSMGSLERVELLKEAVLLDDLGDLMKMWFVLCRLSEEIDLMSKCRVPNTANNCPQNFSEESISKTTQITRSLR